MGVLELQRIVDRTLDQVFSQPHVLRDAFDELAANAKEKVAQEQWQRDELGRRIEDLGRQRRMLSFQHEHEVITSQELLQRTGALGKLSNDIRKSLDALNDEQYQLLPPEEAIAALEQASHGYRLRRAEALRIDPRLEQKEGLHRMDRLADVLGLRIIVHRNKNLSIHTQLPDKWLPSESIQLEDHTVRMVSPSYWWTAGRTRA